MLPADSASSASEEFETKGAPDTSSVSDYGAARATTPVRPDEWSSSPSEKEQDTIPATKAEQNVS